MSELNRRCLLACSVVAAVSGSALAVPTSALTPRARRLLALYAEHERFHRDNAGYSDNVVNAFCEEAWAIGDAINASPAPGQAGLAELAAVALYWYRPQVKHPNGNITGGTEYVEGELATRDVLALINAVLASADGGDDA